MLTIVFILVPVNNSKTNGAEVFFFLNCKCYTVERYCAFFVHLIHKHLPSFALPKNRLFKSKNKRLCSGNASSITAISSAHNWPAGFPPRNANRPPSKEKTKNKKLNSFLLLLLRVMQIWQKKNRPSVVNSLAHIGYSVPTRHRSSRGPSIPFSSPFCFPSVPRENLKSIGLSYLICIFPLFFFSFSGHYFQNKCVISISFF